MKNSSYRDSRQWLCREERIWKRNAQHRRQLPRQVAPWAVGSFSCVSLSTLAPLSHEHSFYVDEKLKEKHAEVWTVQGDSAVHWQKPTLPLSIRESPSDFVHLQQSQGKRLLKTLARVH